MTSIISAFTDSEKPWYPQTSSVRTQLIKEIKQIYYILNYDYPLAGEEKKFFKIVVSEQPEAGRINNVLKKLEEPASSYHKIGR